MLFCEATSNKTLERYSSILCNICPTGFYLVGKLNLKVRSSCKLFRKEFEKNTLSHRVNPAIYHHYVQTIFSNEHHQKFLVKGNIVAFLSPVYPKIALPPIFTDGVSLVWLRP